ncbi:succinyl-CoA synthetase subunit beta [Marinobacter sp. 71-i]|uniref:Succinyl-CoA synthetase subunit beta n=1 Tax=Marinobacter iranensis TaxID=2962607 RepID=A0ABT5Y4Z2_9GAMM|nr:succinyl-CoA synthetase subunit beta [Marinobacter iranensis]MDF0748743.1 succinyl-CoA synthetase subunit beta [Marinobacter iranensis]
MRFTLPAHQAARKARIWQYLAFVGVILAAPFFFVGGPGWTDGPLLKSAWNLGHILFFALLTLAVQPWRAWTGWTLWSICSLVVLLVGAGIELLQYGTSRQVDWQDMLRNLLGLWAVLAARPLASQTRLSLLTAWSLRVIIGALLLAQTGTTAGVAIQQYKVSQLLPALYDFSQPDPSPYWNGAITPVPSDAPHSSQHELRISLSTTRYSGMSLHNFPADWRGYNELVIDLYNPQDQLFGMALRINDIEHDLGDNAYNDRFNTRLTLSPGPNRFRLDLSQVRNAPRGRAMDMQKIRRVILFATGIQEPKTVYLRDIRLE